MQERYPNFTAEQLEALRYGVQESGNMSLRSTAGSGKTTLIRALGRELPRTGRIVAMAFNAAIEQEMRAVMPEDIDTLTSHGCGKQILSRAPNAPRHTVDPFKRRTLVSHWLKAQDLNVSADMLSNLTRLADAALMTLTPADEAALGELAERFGLKVPDEVNLVKMIGEVTNASTALYLKSGQLDFTDMLYLPLKLGLGRRSVSTLLVDEAQDFNKLQRAFCRHLIGSAGRIIMVGDPNQALYTFMGADADSMEQAENLFGCEVKRLTVTFRCPRLHVALAAAFSDGIQAAEGAKEGTIQVVDLADLPTALSGDDLVLCRTNAPLISLALNLAQQHISVHFMGKELGKELEQMMTKALTRDFTPSDVGPLLQNYARELSMALKLRGLSPKALAKVNDHTSDLLGCTAALATRAALSAPGGLASLGDVMALTRTLMNPVRGIKSLRFRTIHGSKGLEANTVAILEYQNLVVEGEDALAERPVNFVAFTRAKETLLLCRGQEA